MMWVNKYPWNSKEPNAWAEMVSIASEWVPTWERSSKIRSIFRSSAREKWKAEEFGRKCIFNLLALAGCYNKAEHVTIFQGGRLPQVPSLAERWFFSRHGNGWLEQLHDREIL
jgi:hypothetical protein